MATQTTHTTTDREVTMSSFSISCPCGCGAAAAATDKGFAATTVTVACCSASLLGTVTMRKSSAYAAADRFAPTTVLRHRDGLVSFGS